MAAPPCDHRKRTRVQLVCLKLNSDEESVEHQHFSGREPCRVGGLRGEASARSLVPFLKVARSPSSRKLRARRDQRQDCRGVPCESFMGARPSIHGTLELPAGQAAMGYVATAITCVNGSLTEQKRYKSLTWFLSWIPQPSSSVRHPSSLELSSPAS